MNKQELIRKYKELWKEHSPFHEPVPYTSMVELFLKELKQLDEPEKVKVPQFVADYIEYAKKEDYHILGAMSEVRKHENKDIEDWLYTDDNIEIFARAWLDGYEVERGKRYIVKVKNTLTRQGTLNRDKRSKKFIFSNPEENALYDTKFTRKELEEAGFGWVFGCEGVVVEEVE
ncbi:DUF1642 domain-containing protein [Streptococcus infantis]|uniref:DUF1642 domain-containing protein n=1 Tax=Streptococcus infantis TaxID=68892 RepID=UPI0039C13D2F